MYYCNTRSLIHDSMTLTVRLSPHLRQQLDSYCKARRLTKTHVITELLNEHLSGDVKSRKTSYELACEFGLVAGLKGAASDLAENRKEYLMEKLRAKRSG